MNLHIPKSKAEFLNHLHDPLFKNSFFIILTSVLGAGFGFIFWILAAKFYSAEDVGIATALISSMALLVLLSRAGLDVSLIRFFPANYVIKGGDEGDGSKGIADSSMSKAWKSRVFSTALIITTSFAILFGVIFITGVDVFSPRLHLLKSPFNAALYLIFLAAHSASALACISFVAVRRASFQFIQSIVVGSRVLFLIPLILLGAVGIFGAVGISFVIALGTAYILLGRLGVRPGFVIDRGFLNDAFHFSVGNYLASLFMLGPNFVLPIMVLNVLGAEQAAYYYIAYAIVALLFKIPHAVSMSLFVEGSHGEALKRAVVKSLFAIFLLMIPAAVILYVWGGWLLGLVGADYASGGFAVLRMMVVASLFVGVNLVYFAIKRVQKDVKGLVVLSGVIGGLLVGFGYVFVVMFGLVGVGYAWLMSNGIGSVMVAVMMLREKEIMR